MVDTNVAVVVEGLNEDADQACIDACMDCLLEVIRSGGLLVDEGGEIVEEYVGALGHEGQPGVGRAFVKWAWDHRFDDTRIRRIVIRERADDGWRRFDEFPDRADLSAFDRNDQ